MQERRKGRRAKEIGQREKKIEECRRVRLGGAAQCGD